MGVKWLAQRTRYAESITRHSLNTQVRILPRPLTFKLNKMEITQEQFESYVDVQESGVTNMFDVRTVSAISGLNRDECIDIMSNYSTYSEKYNTDTNTNG